MSAAHGSQFLESLHSAFIDELIARRPDLKPTLGLPLRQAVCSAPAGDLSGALLSEASIGGAGAVALLAWDGKFETVVGCSCEELWEGLLQRAKSEFARRGVCPAFKSAKSISVTVALPSGVVSPARVIWFPFDLQSQRCFLGIGI